MVERTVKSHDENFAEERKKKRYIKSKYHEDVRISYAMSELSFFPSSVLDSLHFWLLFFFGPFLISHVSSCSELAGVVHEERRMKSQYPQLIDEEHFPKPLLFSWVPNSNLMAIVQFQILALLKAHSG